MDTIKTLFPYSDHDLIDHETSFADFLNLVEKYKIDPDSEIEIVGIKVCDPLEFLAKILAVLLSRKKVLLLPKNLFAFDLNQLNETIEFTFFDKIKAKNHANEFLSPESEIIFLSSGSTSTPVGYGHRLSSFQAHINLFKNFFDPKADELYGMNLPLNHVGGLMLLWRACSFRGRISTDIENTPLDYLSLVPAQVEKMLSDENHLIQLKKLKALFIGGGVFSETLKEELSKHQIVFFETYGMTETLSFIALNQQILDGVVLETLEDQTIVVNSPTLFYQQYKNKKNEVRNSHYITSDLGEIQNGKIKFLGRKDKIFKTGGEKVSKSEVEALLFKHTKLSSFIVSSVKDPKWEDMIVALCEADVNTEEIREKLKKVAPPQKIPRFFLKKNPKLLNGMKITQKDIYKHYLFSLFDHHFIDRHQKETIVVLHGFMENYEDWLFLEKDFLNFNFLFINLPGHGKTQLSHFYHLADLENKLFDFLSFFPEELIMLGYSMGGRVASLLTRLPHLKSLIILSGGLGLQDELEKEQRLKTDHELFLRYPNPVDFFQFWYAQKIFGDFQTHAKYQQMIQAKLTLDLKQIDQSLNLLSPGVFPLNNEIETKLLAFNGKKYYLYGARDEKYAALKDQYRKLHFEVGEIPNAYHNFHKTNPEDLINNLKRFL